MEQNTTSKRAHAFSLSGTLRRLWQRFPEAAVVAALLIVVDLFGRNILAVSLKVNEQWIAVSGLVTGLLAAAALGLWREDPPIPRTAVVAAAVGFILLGASAAYFLPILVPVALWVCLADVFMALFTHKQPPQRVGQLLSAALFAGGLAFGVSLALSLILIAFDSLFHPGDTWFFIITLVESFPPCAFIWLFLGLLPTRKTPADATPGARVILGKVFLPLYLVYLAVLLVYGLAILFVGMPVGVINGVVIAALILYAFLRLTLTGDEGRLSQWFVRWGALPLLPLIALQAVAVWIRCDAYGLTDMRLIGMIVTLLGVGAVICGALRRRPGWLFAATAAAALALAVMGALNVNLSVIDQEARLKAALIRNDMWQGDTVAANPHADDDDKQIIIESYRYLRTERIDGWRVSAWVPDSDSDNRYFVSNDELTSAFGFYAVSDADDETRDLLSYYKSVSSAITTEDLVNVTGYDTAMRVAIDSKTVGEFDEVTFDIGGRTVALQDLVDPDMSALRTESVEGADGAMYRIISVNMHTTNGGLVTSSMIQAWRLTKA